MSKNSAIKVHNLTKTYKLYQEPIDRLKEALHPFKKTYHKDFFALKEVSFEIKRGETVGIIGRNGSGKSTLLKIITGVLTPTQGRVTVHGKISAILELGAGFNPEMTGLENIYLNTSINGLSRKQTDAIVEEIIAFSELGEFIYQPLKTYSSGMKARLAFGVAITVRPDILIVDEALSVGDAAFQRKCFAKMEQIRESGATILFVSHSESSIVALCDRAIWLSQGIVVLDGMAKLIAGLYLKNAHKKKINTSNIIYEYQQLEANLLAQQRQREESVFKALYNPQIQSKSTIVYDEKGARISDVKITTLAGEQVNILTQGEKYVYCYKVDFFEDKKSVNFGFMLKRKDGVPLGGAAYPALHQYMSIKKGSKFVKFVFVCELNNGEYFFNAGVSAKEDSSVDYLHRILDGYMIKVINAKTSITGSVNLVQDIEIREYV